MGIVASSLFVSPRRVSPPLERRWKSLEPIRSGIPTIKVRGETYREQLLANASRRTNGRVVRRTLRARVLRAEPSYEREPAGTRSMGKITRPRATRPTTSLPPFEGKVSSERADDTERISRDDFHGEFTKEIVHPERSIQGALVSDLRTRFHRSF